MGATLVGDVASFYCATLAIPGIPAKPNMANARHINGTSNPERRILALV
jgi:hypothetical protein